MQQQQAFKLCDFSFSNPCLHSHDDNNDMIWNRFDVHEDKSHYYLNIEVPAGVKASDMTLGIEESGRVLYMTGIMLGRRGNCSESRFAQRFRLCKNKIDLNWMTANLSEKDGVLRISAPRIICPNQQISTRRVIPIFSEVCILPEVPRGNRKKIFPTSRRQLRQSNCLSGLRHAPTL